MAIDSAELLSRVRRLEIRTSKVVDEVIGGAYHSVFRGRGIEFDEVREYTTDDDVRDVDWLVSARLNAPYVKKYVEERELSVLILLDVSSSTDFGAPNRGKRDLGVEAAAMLALSAVHNHDRVGLALFDREVRSFLPLRSGRRHGLRIIRELVAAETESGCGTDVAGALRKACGVLHKRSVIFLITDLIDPSPEVEKALKIANRRHDVVVLHLFDPAAITLPAGALDLYDAESGAYVHLKGRAAQKRFAEAGRRAVEAREELCRKAGVETIELPCGADLLATLMNFFRKRRTRRARGGGVKG